MDEKEEIAYMTGYMDALKWCQKTVEEVKNERVGTSQGADQQESTAED